MTTATVSVLQEFLCSICLEYFKEPHSLQPCNHVFCKECLMQLINSNISHCPQCRTNSTGHCPDDFMAHKMNTTEIHCTVCDMKMRASELNRHLTQCTDRVENFQQVDAGRDRNNSQSTMYRCPYCRNEIKGCELAEHCKQFHRNDKAAMVCPICSTMPWGNPHLKCSHLISHLQLRHRFDYDSYPELWEANEDDALTQAVIQSLEPEEADLNRALAESLAMQRMPDVSDTRPGPPRHHGGDITTARGMDEVAVENVADRESNPPDDSDDNDEFHQAIIQSLSTVTDQVQGATASSHPNPQGIPDDDDDDEFHQAIIQSLSTVTDQVQGATASSHPNPQGIPDDDDDDDEFHQAIIQSLSTVTDQVQGATASSHPNPQGTPDDDDDDEFHQAIIQSLSTATDQVQGATASSHPNPQGIPDDDDEFHQVITQSLSTATDQVQGTTASSYPNHQEMPDEFNRAVFRSPATQTPNIQDGLTAIGLTINPFRLLGINEQGQAIMTSLFTEVVSVVEDSLAESPNNPGEAMPEEDDLSRAICESLACQTQGNTQALNEAGRESFAPRSPHNLDLNNAHDDDQTLLNNEETRCSFQDQFETTVRSFEAQTLSESLETQTQTLSESHETQTQTLSESYETQTQTLSESLGTQTQTFSESLGTQTQTFSESLGTQTQTLSKSLGTQTQITLSKFSDAETQTPSDFFEVQTQTVNTEANGEASNVQTTINESVDPGTGYVYNHEQVPKVVACSHGLDTESNPGELEIEYSHNLGIQIPLELDHAGNPEITSIEPFQFEGEFDDNETQPQDERDESFSIIPTIGYVASSDEEFVSCEYVSPEGFLCDTDKHTTCAMASQQL